MISNIAPLHKMFGFRTDSHCFFVMLLLPVGSWYNFSQCSVFRTLTRKSKHCRFGLNLLRVLYSIRQLQLASPYCSEWERSGRFCQGAERRSRSDRLPLTKASEIRLPAGGRGFIPYPRLPDERAPGRAGPGRARGYGKNVFLQIMNTVPKEINLATWKCHL